MHAYIHTFIHTYIHSYIHTYMYMKLLLFFYEIIYFVWFFCLIFEGYYDVIWAYMKLSLCSFAMLFQLLWDLWPVLETNQGNWNSFLCIWPGIVSRYLWSHSITLHVNDDEKMQRPPWAHHFLGRGCLTRLWDLQIFKHPIHQGGTILYSLR